MSTLVDLETGLRSVSENRYLSTKLMHAKLQVDEEADPQPRYSCSVMVTSPQVNWFIVKPDERGFEPVIGYKNQIRALGHRRLSLDDCLEFRLRHRLRSTRARCGHLWAGG